MTGNKDYVVASEGSRRLWRRMTSNRNIDEKGEQDLTPSRRVELVQWEDTGHGIHLQREREFNELITRCVREGRNLNGSIAGLSMES